MFEERNLHRVTLHEVMVICAHFKTCKNRPFKGEFNSCRFAGVTPMDWRLD